MAEGRQKGSSSPAPGTMMLIDSNILIYAATPQHKKLREFIQVQVSAVSILANT